MNEKIRELALRSQLISVNDLNGDLVSSYQEDVDLSEELEAFANMIIKECVTTIETYNNNSLTKKIADEGVYSYEQGAIAGMNESVLVIKQHFGVEE